MIRENNRGVQTRKRSDLFSSILVKLNAKLTANNDLPGYLIKNRELNSEIVVARKSGSAGTPANRIATNSAISLFLPLNHFLMSSLLLAESGSTKTDWCFIQKGQPPVHFQTAGINPYLQSEDEIGAMLHAELDPAIRVHSADQIYFYGAGIGSETIQQSLQRFLGQFFGIQSVEVESDMMAAARSLCGKDKGVVCILGTGSNSCYYDGVRISRQLPSLGYIAGDEGSGNHMGKRILQYYAYLTFDEELRAAFERMTGNKLTEVIRKLYKEPFPNRYLASFAPLLAENRGHYMVENIIEDCLNDFFMQHISKYRESWTQQIHFTGSISWVFRDVVATLCSQYELELGTVSKSPLEGLIQYHMRSI